MTKALASKTCTPCRGGTPPLTREQAELLHAQASDWQLAEEANRIERSFRFRNFREVLTFVQEIGELAEAEGHHPNSRTDKTLSSGRLKQEDFEHGDEVSLRAHHPEGSAASLQRTL